MNINSKTHVCCIIGNPIEHSLSPQMYNAAFQALNLDFTFVAFHVTDVEEAIRGIRALGIRGVVVTIPHKQTVIEFVDELDETAKAIGAVNTIVNENGVLKATNTDYIGALTVLTNVLASQGETLQGKRVSLLGAGGAARALAYGLKKEGARVIVCNRTRTHAEQLVKDLMLDSSAELGDTKTIKTSDIIINATSVGMDPKSNESPINPDCIQTHHVVYDIVYKPRETKLLRFAKEKNATVVYGDKMLLYQALPQFELFTGKKAPFDVMEQALKKALERKH